MRKGKKAYNKKQYVTNRKKDALDDYDIKNFMVDNAVIASFDYLDRSKRDWIITRRYELMKLRNLGRKSVWAILDFVEKNNLDFKENGESEEDFYIRLNNKLSNQKD